MARLPLMAAAALAFVASPSLFCATTVPASAQELSDRGGDLDDGDLRDFLMDELRIDRDRRDLLLDLIRERRGQGSELLDRIGERRDLGDDLLDLVRGRRDRRSELLDRIGERRDLRDELIDMIGGRGDLLGRIRERIAERRGDDRNCYIFNGSFGGEDRNLFVVLRGRVCRD